MLEAKISVLRPAIETIRPWMDYFVGICKYWFDTSPRPLACRIIVQDPSALVAPTLNWVVLMGSPQFHPFPSALLWALQVWSFHFQCWCWKTAAAINFLLFFPFCNERCTEDVICFFFFLILVAMGENNSLANRRTEKVGNTVIINNKKVLWEIGRSETPQCKLLILRKKKEVKFVVNKTVQTFFQS